MDSRFYTVNQVAQMFKMHPKTIRRYIRDDSLSARKIGGQWRISEEELKKFLSSDQEFKKQITEQLQQEVTSFIEGGTVKADGKIQMLTIVDVFVDEESEARQLTSSMMEIINNTNSSQKPAAKFNFTYQEEEKKARYILSGSPDFVSKMINLLEKV